jgi:hypothetical protein
MGPGRQRVGRLIDEASQIAPAGSPFIHDLAVTLDRNIQRYEDDDLAPPVRQYRNPEKAAFDAEIESPEFKVMADEMFRRILSTPIEPLSAEDLAEHNALNAALKAEHDEMLALQARLRTIAGHQKPESAS